MIGVARLAGSWFNVITWAVIFVALAMIVIGGADVILSLKWGFTSKDVGMAAVVLVIAIMVRMIGSRIIAAVGGV